MNVQLMKDIDNKDIDIYRDYAYLRKKIILLKEISRRRLQKDKFVFRREQREGEKRIK